MNTIDLDVLKDVPGYRAIMKTVVKSLIQVLLEQLSEHTAEESLILTASVNDGSLSHLGSRFGKGFLEGREEIKSQFLGYCLKAQQKSQENTDTLEHDLSLGSVSGFKAGNQKRPKPYERLLTGQQHTFQGNSQKQQQRKRQSDRGELDYFPHDVSNDNSLPVSYSMGNNNTSSPIFPQRSLSYEGDHSKNVLPQTQSNVKSENETEADESEANQERSVKVEVTSDSDIELTGVEEGDVSLDYSQTGFNTSGHLQNFGHLFGLNASDSDLSGTFQSHLVDSITGEREYKCDVCSKGFRSKQNVIRHKRIHTGDKPFPCLYCMKSFRMKHHMRGHIASTHPEFITDFINNEGKL